MHPKTRFLLLALPLLIVLGLAVAGCSRIDTASPALAMQAPSTAKPFAYTPLPPTATAVVFQLKPSSTPLPSPTPIAIDLAYGYGPANFQPNMNPLTGLFVDNPTRLERRPMAIKVTNYPRSVRPQWGLTHADHVYEYYIGDDMTRFISVFYGQDAGRVGPVRSGRFFDEHIVRMTKAIFVFASADERVLDPWLESDLRNRLIIERPDNCPPLCRIGPEWNYNTLFVDTEALTGYINARGTSNERQPLEGLRFEKAAPFSSLPGTRLSISFTRLAYLEWEWDPAAGRYLRYQEAEDEHDGERSYLPHTDSETGEQLAADNLVILLLPHEYFINTQTTEMVKMEFLGQGPAYAYRDGKAYTLLWQRAAPENLLSLTYPDGRPYPLKPGNTWFEVLGRTSTVLQLPDGVWDFQFNIP